MGDPEALPRGRPIDARRVADRGAGDVARLVGSCGPQCVAGRFERDGQDVGEAGGSPDRASGDHVAIPQDDGDAQRGRSEEDRDRDVAAGREDRRRSKPREDRGRLWDRRAQAERIEDRVDVEPDRPQRAQDEALERDARCGDEAGFQTTVAAEPGELSGVRSSAQRPGDGQRRVDMPARPAAGDQQSHRRSRSPSRWSRARSRAGSRSPRS
jgi:hypothetical protein